MADLGAMIGQMVQQPDSGQQIASTLQGLGQQAQQSRVQEREMAMQEQRQELLNEQRRAQIEKLSQEMDMNDLEMARQEKEVLANEATGLLQHFDQQGNVKNVVAYERAYQNAKERAREMGSDVSDFPSEAPMDPTVLQQFRDSALGAEQVARQAHEMKAIKARQEGQMELARLRNQRSGRGESGRETGPLFDGASTSKGIDRGDIMDRLRASAVDDDKLFGEFDEEREVYPVAKEGYALPEWDEEEGAPPEMRAFATKIADAANQLTELGMGPSEAKDFAQEFYTRQARTPGKEAYWWASTESPTLDPSKVEQDLSDAIRQVDEQLPGITNNPQSLKTFFRRVNESGRADYGAAARQVAEQIRSR